MWFLSLSCLFSVGMEKTMPVVPRKTHQMNYKYVLKSKFLTKKKCDGVKARERERYGLR